MTFSWDIIWCIVYRSASWNYPPAESNHCLQPLSSLTPHIFIVSVCGNTMCYLNYHVKSPWFSLNHISHLATVEIRVVRLGSFQNLYLSFAIVEITHGVTANRDDTDFHHAKPLIPNLITCISLHQALLLFGRCLTCTPNSFQSSCWRRSFPLVPSTFPSMGWRVTELPLHLMMWPK